MWTRHQDMLHPVPEQQIGIKSPTMSTSRTLYDCIDKSSIELLNLYYYFVGYNM